MHSADQDFLLHLDLGRRPARRDETIVAEAQAGSSAAFEQLQPIYRRKLYSRVVAITKNREDAEDALQDTFLRAYLALPRFEGRSSVYSWLTRIAINSALMILRRRRVRSEVFFDTPIDKGEGPMPFEIRDTAPNPEQICDHRQRRVRLLDGIQKLEPKLRVPFRFFCQTNVP